jgi:hypothetical protein
LFVEWYKIWYKSKKNSRLVAIWSPRERNCEGAHGETITADTGGPAPR